jgi:hypothetical protein
VVVRLTGRRGREDNWTVHEGQSWRYVLLQGSGEVGILNMRGCRVAGLSDCVWD